MSLKKSVCVVSLGTLVGVLVYGCSSTTNNGTGTGDDAGTAMDSSTMHDSAPADAHPSDAKNDAITACAPADVSGFTPPAYVPAHRQVGACTDTQITDFFTNCFDTGHTKAMCDTFKAGATACAACIEGPSTASTWAASVTHGGVVTINVGGCMEILGGTDGLDCAHKSQAAEACDNAACDATCPVTDDASFQLYLACIQQAAANGCSATATAVQTCEMALANGDGGAVICTQGSNFQDIYTNVIPVFCGGGGSADAGDGG